MSYIIDMRSSSYSYQPCWECGQMAGSHEGLYYGNFAFGIAHKNCKLRIEMILDRSLRALSTFGESKDRQTPEMIRNVLITTSANKLGNCPLNTIKDDSKIRSVVETEGMIAALAVLRSISKLNDSEWEKCLKEHHKIMQGAEFIQKKPSDEELRQFESMFNAGLEWTLEHK